MYQDIINKICEALTPDLLKGQYKKKEQLHHLAGHCYVASEAAYHLLGGSDTGWKVYMLNHKQFPEGLKEGETHWFIKNHMIIIDPTVAQFKGIEIPYDKAKRKAFLTNKPSKRTMKIIKLINQHN